MKIANNITELIGQTPIVKINKLNRGLRASIYLKLEFFNPLSSIKDRIGLSMIEDAEKRGIIKKDTVIIEPTSGNTGIALAFISAQRGYRLILTMPDTMSIERRALLKFFGAELILTKGELGMKGAIDKAEELHQEIPNSIILQQFNNPANPDIHRRTTAQEILEAFGRDIDIIIAGVGTGGTITGTGEVLKKEIPNIKIIAVEPENSAVISGEAPGKHKIQGIGAGFIPSILNKSIIDDVIKVSDFNAVETSRSLAKEEGILCGLSGGANLYAALQEAKRYKNADKKILTFAPDTGERYLSTSLFNYK